MEKLKFDSGVRAYRLEGMGVLRMQPADPNLYTRFLEAAEQLKAVEASLTGEDPLEMMARADREMKAILNGVFGLDNDFEKILCGVNLLAAADNGQRVITNLLEALAPVLLEGARRCAGEAMEQAREKAARRRAAQ